MDRTLAAERDAEIAAIAFVRAISGVVGAVEERHIDVFARDVLNRGIGGFAQSERFSRVGDHPPRDRDDDPSGIAFDRDRMIRSGNFDRLCCGCDIRFHGFHLLVRADGSRSLPGIASARSDGCGRTFNTCSVPSSALTLPQTTGGRQRASWWAMPSLSSSAWGSKYATQIDVTFPSRTVQTSTILIIASVPATPMLITA